MVKYDPARKMTYVYDDGDGPDTFVGVTLLDEAGVSCRAIWNEGNNPLNTTWGIYDGFSDAEKWECLSSGTVNVEAGPGDISHVIAAGPFTLAPNERIALHFALAAGADFNKLCQAVDAAKTFNRSMTADKKSQQATTWSLSANHPNPFNSTTVIAYELQQTARVTLELFDLNLLVCCRATFERFLLFVALARRGQFLRLTGRMAGGASFLFFLAELHGAVRNSAGQEKPGRKNHAGNGHFQKFH